MNSVQLIGRLTRDPELRYTQSQKAVCKFTIAIDRGKDKGADFIPIVVWDRTAEVAEKYLKKGRQVAIEGRIQTGSYQKDDGTKVYTTDVVAHRVHFIYDRPKEEQKDEPIPDSFAAIQEEVPF